jgi:uncharacterized protein YjdB
MKNYLKTWLTFFLFLCSISTNAQVTDTTVFLTNCGADADVFLKGATDTHSPPLSVPVFPPSAIMTCGKVDVYFEDVRQHLRTGFDDSTLVGPDSLGVVRRNTFCAALSYIQSVFDFSKVSPANHIRVYVDTSFNHTFHRALFGTTFLAFAFPQYDSSTNGVKNGWLNDYVNGGTDPGLGKFHGFVTVNFDRTFDMYGLTALDSPLIGWHDDYYRPFVSSSSCGQIDLYSTLLHEMGHAMGWFSLVRFPTGGAGTGLTPHPLIKTHNVFSGLDWSFYVGNNSYPLSLTKFLAPPVTSPTLDTTNPLFYSNNNYWINDSAAPRNHPMYSGTYGGGGLIQSFLSHLEDQPYTYTLRERISPGDQQEYVMGPFILAGTLRRTYSKGELQSFVDILGYKLLSSYTGLNPNIYPNHLPFSKKMANYGITQSNYGFFTETVTPDATLTNNVGATYTMSIPAMVAGGDITDADPSDIGNLYIDTTTLVNFRGCGIGGNNHLRLSVSSDSKHITFTPRPNFYGRAQWGFNITDGKERGSFVVMTVDVLKGNNVSCVAGSNMVCNPGFEEGSEIRIDTVAEAVPNATRYEGGIHEGKWQGICFSDAHPYCFATNMDDISLGTASGTIVKNSDVACGLLPTSTSESGSAWLSSPTIWGGGFYSSRAYDNPLPYTSSGDRYQNFGAPARSYYYLADSARSCHNYILEFDLFRTYLNPFTGGVFKIGLTDRVVDLSTVNPDTTLNVVQFDTVAIPYRAWTHYSVRVKYCSDKPSNVLYLAYAPSELYSQIHLDNLSLKQDTVALPPLLVTIADTGLAGCKMQLSAHDSNAFCSISYRWSATAETVLTAEKDTVLSNVVRTYTVTAFDGCRDTTATFKVKNSAPGPISGPITLCAGSTIGLSDTVAGGAWTSSNTLIASIDVSKGIVTGISSGTVIISYTTFCSNTVTYTITVKPAPSAIIGSATICVGIPEVLSDAVGGGTWTSSTTTVAIVGITSGLVSGLSSGTAIITYALTSGCSATFIVTITASVPSPITGDTVFCLATATTLTDTLPGGTWSSSNTSVAVLYSSSVGVVFGTGPGTATITYTPLCGRYVTINVTVLPSLPAISGILSICSGSTTTLSDAVGGGTWTCSNTAVASVGSGTGIVMGISTGTATIIYRIGSCAITATIWVDIPSPVTGPAFVCIGSTIMLSDITTGGTWTSSTTTVATIGLTTGVVTGISAGTVVVTYTSPCGYPVTISITVSPHPSIITGPATLCLYDYIFFTDSIPGGTWSSSNTFVATVSPSGFVYALFVGPVTISYTICGNTATKSIFINALPGPINGAFSVCVGNSTRLSDAITGGAWSSSDTTIAKVGHITGTVTGISPGIVNITYTLFTGCYITQTFTVNALPGAIAGPLSVCAGSTITLSDTTSGGTWSSSNTSVALIGLTTAIVTPVSAGITTITYILPTGCMVTTTITVNPIPITIVGTMAVCMGTSTTLSDVTPGGTWSSSNTSVATISLSSGTVTPVSAGVTTITYMLPTGCYVKATFTVHAFPAPISGAVLACTGLTSLLSHWRVYNH